MIPRAARLLRPPRLSCVVAALVGLALAGCGGDPGTVRGSGTIELDEIDVSSLVGGRVARILVDEGDAVRAGDTLAVLDRGEISADLQAQAAQADRAVAQWRDLQSGSRPAEVETARAELAAAAAQRQLAEADYARTEALFKSKVVAQAELDRARAGREAAIARDRAARESLRLVETGFRHGQVAAAREAAAAATAQLAAARSRAHELSLVAPISGVVLLRNYQAGELAPAGLPVVTLGNPDSLWMRVFVAAPLLPKLRLGAPAEVRVSGASRAFPGRVVEIATRAEFTPRAALTEEERANLVFGVKVKLAPSGGVLKAGLPATAFIRAASSEPPR